MDELEQDRALIVALVEWSGDRPATIARKVVEAVGGTMANTTIGRHYNGTASANLSRATLDRLRATYPDFPGWSQPEATPSTNAIPFKMEGASAERMRENLPIFGTALGASRIIDGEAIEQTTLNTGEVVAYAKRPVILNGNAKAYGLYVQGSSMYPVHPEGSLILAEEKRPPRVGDDVVVYLRANGDDDDGQRSRAVLVKRLVRRTAEYVELEQFTPAVTFRIEREKVLRVDRVLTLGDLLA